MARPAGLSDKEYYEKYVTEAEFLDWYKSRTLRDLKNQA